MDEQATEEWRQMEEELTDGEMTGTEFMACASGDEERGSCVTVKVRDFRTESVVQTSSKHTDVYSCAAFNWIITNVYVHLGVLLFYIFILQLPEYLLESAGL